MKILFEIAWRNLWGNRRRTILTAASVTLALASALFLRSMQFGSYELMIRAGVSQVGYLQVHDTGYWNNQSIDRAFFYNDNLGEILHNTKGISHVLPVLQTFSLASYGNRTKGILISGIDPVKENQQTNLSGKVIKGSYLKENSSGVIMGDKLAEYLKMKVGDTLVLIGRGYRGITAYGIYPVSGIFHMPLPKMNNQVVFMNVTDAQNFVYPYRRGLLTGISVFIQDPSQLNRIKKTLTENLGKHYEVISWETMLTDLLQFIKVDNAIGQIILLILYLLAAFGIFSTVLMMTMEKRKQYAVMISIGMLRRKLVWVSIFETFIISVLGVIIGLLIISPVLYYLHLNPIPVTGNIANLWLSFNFAPIIPFSIKAHIFVSQTIIILTLSFLSAFYPIIYISKFNVLNAFRH